MPLKSRLLALLSLAIFFVPSCKKTQEFPTFNPEFIHYISAYSSGVIDKTSSIKVVLLKPVEDTTGLFKKTQSLFKFSPSIEGSAKYLDAQTFIFEPNEPLPAGKVYQASFKLGSIIEIKKELRTFKFQFETERQHLSYSYSSLNSHADPSMQYLEGRVRLTDEVEVEDLKDVLYARLGGGPKLNVKWSHSYGKNYNFRIDSIERGEESAMLTCAFSGSSIGASESYNKQFVIRGLADFNISNVDVVLEPDQKIVLNFSDPLDPNQDLNGLITVSGVTKFQLDRSNNSVTVFFPTRVAGNRTLTVSNKVKNYNGYNLREEYKRSVFFKKPKPKIRIVGEGTIYPMNETVYFPFETVGLKAVDVRVFKIYDRNVHQFLQVNELDDNSQLKRVGKLVYKGKVDLKSLGKAAESNWRRSTLDLSKHIAKDPGAIYRVMLSFKKSYTFWDCTNSDTDFEADENEMYWRYYSDYYYTENYTPCNSNFYYRSARTKNIIASQLGVIAKRARNNNYHLFVNHINTSQPIPNVRLQFFDYQRNIIKEVYTNGSGMASVKLPDDEQPFLLVANSGRQRSYLKLRDGNSNSLSKFQVSGVAPNKDGIKGFVYGERGVWRPGDDIYLAFIMENPYGQSYPVKMELYDPDGKVVDTKVTRKNTGGIYSLKTATKEGARTGNYRAVVTVGNATYYKSLKIETVKPNRLKMNLKFDRNLLSSHGVNKGKLKASWLHGAKARGLKARVRATVNSGSHPFKNYKNYTFSDPTKRFETQSMIVFEDKLDDNGETELKPEFGIKKGAPGFLSVTFNSEVYEKSGNFSTDNSYFKLSPFDFYAGIDVADGKLEHGTLVTGKDHDVDLVSLSESGKTQAGRDLEVKVYKMGWSWWWERNRNITNYVSANNLQPYKVRKLKTNSSGKAVFKLRVNQPDYGRFLILVHDPQSGHSTGKIVYVDWPYWARSNRKNPDNASMLTFTTNKKVYKKGEEVKISIPGAPQGKLLVCVENGSDVLKKFWTNATNGETKITFTTTADMSPNVYVHIMGLQDYSKTANDLPVRMYGILPIRVEDPMTHIYPKITMKDSIRPDQFQYVSVSEKSGRPMAYTLAIVDEGLLDLTSYRTPDPWNHFNQKEALGVVTWDIYSHVIGAFGAHWGNVLAVGGGFDRLAMKKKPVKANRFKPVVKYFGPYYLNANQNKSHKFKISNYVGAVRVMVVAANNGAYGNAEKSVKVKQPLMVLSTLPRTLSPSEDIEIPVNVFAMQNDMGKVKVELKAVSGLTIIGDKTKTLDFKEMGDEVVTFKAKVKEMSGVVKVEAKVSSGSEKASHKTEMNIRLPNPTQHKVQEWALDPGKSISGTVAQFGILGTSKTTLEVSRIPSINLTKRLNYLIKYPHGCIEQTTSSVFPQIYLSKMTNLTETQKRSVQRNVEAAIERLQNFQTSGGGFSYWPGRYYVSEWGTNYAGHFLIEAEKQGYIVPSHLKSNWIEHQKSKANSWVPSQYYNAHLQQAYRLYTLALAGQAQLAAMNRLRQEPKLDQIAAWKLAGAYALIGRREVAKQLTSNLPKNVKEYRELSYTFGSSFRDKALILQTLTEMGSSTEATKLAIDIAKELGKPRWFSTQETAYGLMSMANYIGKFANSDQLDLNYTVNGQNKNVTSTKSVYTIDLKKKQNSYKLNNTGSNVLYVKMANSGVPLEPNTSKAQENLELKVVYSSMDGQVVDISRLQQGEQFVAQVSIKNLSTHRNLEQMALTQMVPSGWEIQNSRMTGSTFTTPESRFDYKDFRDDRVNTYFGLKPKETKTFRVVLTATYLGKYILPVVQCEAMYDNSVHANEPGQWIEVVQSGETENAEN